MKKLIGIIFILASFLSEGQGLLNIRKKDSTLHFKYWFSANNPSKHGTLRPIWYQELSRNNSASLKMFVIDTARAAAGLKAGYWTDVPAGTTPIDTSNKWITYIERIPGMDSIIFWKGGNRYAIKDSVGSGGGGTPAGSDTYLQYNASSSFGGNANLVYTYSGNVSTLKVRAGSSQSTNHLQEWNANDNTLRMAFTSDYKLRLTQTGGGYDQYMSVATVNSLPGSFKFESYTGDYWATHVNSTDITYMGSTTSQLINYNNPVRITSGVSNPFKVISSGSATAIEAYRFGGVDIPTGLALAYVAKTANYTATLADNIINCTANTFTVTLPDATAVTPKFEYTIKNSGTGVITVATTTSQTIDGVTTYSLPTQYDWVTVQSNGANWIIKGKTAPIVTSDTTRIVTLPSGYTATAYSPRTTFMYEKALRYTIGDSVVNSARITTTDSTASFDLPTYMPVQTSETGGLTATTDLMKYTTPASSTGIYEIALKLKVSAVAGGGVLTTVLTYQDEDNATVTYTMITTGAASTLTATGTFHYPTIQIATYNSTEIKVTSTLTVGTMTYNSYGTITYVRKVPL